VLLHHPTAGKNDCESSIVVMNMKEASMLAKSSCGSKWMNEEVVAVR
jgi:hypothetical protein